jgi:hypothetical protein
LPKGEAARSDIAPPARPPAAAAAAAVAVAAVAVAAVAAAAAAAAVWLSTLHFCLRYLQ